MSTTQHSEGMNNIFKMKIKSHFVLLEFMSKYEGVIGGMREQENAKDHEGHMLYKNS